MVRGAAVNGATPTTIASCIQASTAIFAVLLGAGMVLWTSTNATVCNKLAFIQPSTTSRTIKLIMA